MRSVCWLLIGLAALAFCVGTATAFNSKDGAAVLAHSGLGDLAAEITGDELRAVANAQDRHARVVDRRIDRWRTVDVYRRGTAREDDRLGPARQHLGDRHGTRHDLAVDVRLAYASGDQLRVLRAEIDDENQIVLIVAHAASDRT